MKHKVEHIHWPCVFLEKPLTSAQLKQVLAQATGLPPAYIFHTERWHTLNWPKAVILFDYELFPLEFQGEFPHFVNFSIDPHGKWGQYMRRLSFAAIVTALAKASGGRVITESDVAPDSDVVVDIYDHTGRVRTALLQDEQDEQDDGPEQINLQPMEDSFGYYAVKLETYLNITDVKLPFGWDVSDRWVVVSKKTDEMIAVVAHEDRAYQIARLLNYWDNK